MGGVKWFGQLVELRGLVPRNSLIPHGWSAHELSVKDQPDYRRAGLNGEDVGIPASEGLGAGSPTRIST